MRLQIGEQDIWSDIERKHIKTEKVDNDFHVRIFPADETSEYGSQRGQGAAFPRIKIPEDVPNGTYILAVELYQPSEEAIKNKVVSNLKFNHPEKMLSRRRIPIVIGNPEKTLDVSYINFQSDYGYDIGLRNLDESPLVLGSSDSTKGLTLEYRVPEEDFVRTVDGKDAFFSRGFVLPDARPELPGFSTEVRTLEVRARDTMGNNIFYTAFPIQRVYKYTNTYGEQVYEWNFGLSDKSFAEKLVEYRKRAYESDKQPE